MTRADRFYFFPGNGYWLPFRSANPLLVLKIVFDGFGQHRKIEAKCKILKCGPKDNYDNYKSIFFGERGIL